MLNAAVKQKHTQSEWRGLERKYALMAYSDFGSDQDENELFNSQYKNESLCEEEIICANKTDEDVQSPRSYIIQNGFKLKEKDVQVGIEERA